MILVVVADDDSRLTAQNCRSRRENIERLKSELKSMENEAMSKQAQIDSFVAQLNVCCTLAHSLRTPTPRRFFFNVQFSPGVQFFLHANALVEPLPHDVVLVEGFPLYRDCRLKSYLL